MNKAPAGENQILSVNNFIDLVSTPFKGNINAITWQRTLPGDFKEIVDKTQSAENITELDPEQLSLLELSKAGMLARDVLLHDYHLLKEYGAQPAINIIRSYERDADNLLFPTDVYSFHVDRSPVASDTFLCTYYGAPSDILPNVQAIQKVLVPEIREGLKKLYAGTEKGFDAFVAEHFFDLHYMALPGAQPISLGIGNMWRLATDNPQSKVPPCIHRAPEEKDGESRLLLIC